MLKKEHNLQKSSTNTKKDVTLSNIIDAIINLINHNNFTLRKFKDEGNKATKGKDLEEYVKDMFANTFDKTGEDRNKELLNIFSHLGDENNPPDAILKGGDAIEVKKTDNLTGKLQLNSSHPKSKLNKDDPMITQQCKDAEPDNWEKDILYIIGFVKNNIVKHLSMIYGIDYCSSGDPYSNLKEKIKNIIAPLKNDYPNEYDTKTKELAHFNKIDPLKISSLRVRAMWVIDNPLKVFSEKYTPPKKCNFSLMCIIDNEIWEKLKNVDKISSFAKKHNTLNISDDDIKDPNAPDAKRPVKLITFHI